MRCRLVAALLLAAASLWTSPVAVADDGNNQDAGAGLDEDAADVFAGEFATDGERPQRGGGNIVCHYYDVLGDEVSLYELPPETYGQQVRVERWCEDLTTGEYVSIGEVIVTPPLIPPVPPRDLALMARSRLPLPLPEARTSPNGEQTVQLASWLWVENWAAESRSAQAGGVTATVTATPVSQTWRFGNGDAVSCDGPGKAYDTTKPATDQSTDCSYTYRRSSAGQPGERFAATATLTWHITWTSNIGQSGDLGLVSRTRPMPMRVAEQQAVNESGGTDQ